MDECLIVTASKAEWDVEESVGAETIRAVQKIGDDAAGACVVVVKGYKSDRQGLRHPSTISRETGVTLTEEPISIGAKGELNCASLGVENHCTACAQTTACNVAATLLILKTGALSGSTPPTSPRW